MMEEKLRYFGAKVNGLIGGSGLSREDAKEMFRQVLLNEQPDLQQGAFLAAITAKGATPQEIAGSWEAIYEIDTVKVTPRADGPLVENCGTGMDALKTFNISTAASVVAAADGVLMAKHGARAITSRCGTIDMLEALGLDMECEVSVVKRSIETAGIGIFNGMSPKVHPVALGRILSQIRFGTILNIAASLANPALPAIGARGVYSQAMIMPALETMREIGFKRAMVFHGLGADGSAGMDEMSTLGRTIVAEMGEDGAVRSYEIAPRDMGLQTARAEDILSSPDREREVLRFLRVLGGEEDGARQDIVCLNTAPMLYMTGRVSSLAEGVERARSIIADGRALGKLQDWIKAQNTDPAAGLDKFDDLVSRADAAA